MRAMDLIPLAAVIALGMSTMVHRSMMTAAQPTRLKLAEKGEKLLARTDVPKHIRRDVEAMLDNAFPCNCVLMFLIVPIMPLLVFGWLAYRLRTPARREAMTPEITGRYLELRSLHRKIELANHPVLTPVMDFVVTVSLTLAIPVLVLIRRGAEVALDRDGAALSLEMQRQASKWVPNVFPHRRAA